MATVEYAHIALDEKGMPIIAGTGTKVIQLVEDHIHWGWDAEEIHRQHPQLSLGEIHSALGYYYDHQDEMQAEMKRRDELASEIKAQQGSGPASEKPAGEKTAPSQPRVPGLGKDLILFIADDFDAPLEDFKEYME